MACNTLRSISTDIGKSGLCWQFKWQNHEERIGIIIGKSNHYVTYHRHSSSVSLWGFFADYRPPQNRVFPGLCGDVFLPSYIWLWRWRQGFSERNLELQHDRHNRNKTLELMSNLRPTRINWSNCLTPTAYSSGSVGPSRMNQSYTILFFWTSSLDRCSRRLEVLNVMPCIV